MADSFFTWEALSAMGGASLLTFFVVQYTKSMTRMQTDRYAVVVAYVILLAAQFATGASVANWRVYFLTFANSFLVAAAAGQMHNKVVNPPVSIRVSQITPTVKAAADDKGDNI